MTASPISEMFTVDDIAERLHVHPQTVRGWIRKGVRKGGLGCHRFGRRTLVSAEQLARFLAEHNEDGD